MTYKESLKQAFGALSKSWIWRTVPMQGLPARQAACSDGVRMKPTAYIGGERQI